jgi:hypothetical protein
MIGVVKLKKLYSIWNCTLAGVPPICCCSLGGADLCTYYVVTMILFARCVYNKRSLCVKSFVHWSHLVLMIAIA